MNRLTYAQFFKVLAKNKDVFLGISEELDSFIHQLPSTCAGCYYRKVSHIFPNIVNQSKAEVERHCSLFLKQDTEIS